MTRPRLSRRRLSRALAALVVMLGALSAPIERLVPDAHDGDANGTGSAAISRVGSGAASVTLLDDSSMPGSDQHQPTPQGPVHSTHVDHCAHGHVLIMVASARAYIATVPSPDPFDLSSQRLASISLAPHQRPPIA